jgi:4-amino-4-deoxy-L-arabinose transferase-like glycosyltransferase
MTNYIEPPLEFHPMRQYRGLLISRAIYDQMLPSAPQWQKDLSVQQMNETGLIEPPVTESIVALTNLVTGREKYWYGRVYSILFWTLGAVGLYLLSKKFFNSWAALVAVVFYEMLPYAAIASRSFQPDPLLVCVLIFTVWAFINYLEKDTWKWVAIAGILAGATIFIKQVGVFFIGALFVIGFLSLRGLKPALKDRKVWVMALLTVLPVLIFTLYGLLSGGLQQQLDDRFFPQYWLRGSFYTAWLLNLEQVFDLPVLILGLAGIVVMPDKRSRTILISLWVGYLLMGFTLSHHITTHNYYHLPLIPVVAIGIGALADAVLRRVSRFSNIAAAVFSLCIAVYIGVFAWQEINTIKAIDNSFHYSALQQAVHFLPQNVKVASITDSAGYSLEYYGWVDAVAWPSTSEIAFAQQNDQMLDLRQEFEKDIAGRQYFVVTVLEELDKQPQVKQWLDQYEVLMRGSNYIIYDLQHPKK